MGKVRKRKPNKKPNVVSNNSISQEEELAMDFKENAIQTMIDQLQTVNVEEKYCGLQTFAMLIENPDTLELMIHRDIVKIVAPLLLDQASSIRNAAAGSLRNLSALKHETCDVLMKNDVMTPLVCYFHQYTESWTPDLKSKAEEENIDTFVHCTHLLLNLCESSDTAVKYVGQTKILDILPKYMDLSTSSFEMVSSVMQCLFIIVEDNPLAVEKIKSSSVKQLRQLMSLDANDIPLILLKTLAGGIILNLYQCKIDTIPILIMNEIIEILGKTLSIDHRQASNHLSSSVPLNKTTSQEDNSDETSKLKDQIAYVSRLLDAQQKAIEIVTNICACSDSNDDDDEEPDCSDSDGMDDEEDNQISGDGVIVPNDRLPTHILEAIVSLQIYNNTWRRTSSPAENVVMILKEYEGTKFLIEKLHNLRVKALLCINNLLLVLPLEYVNKVEGLYKCWVDAGQIAFKDNTKSLELLEASTAVMRAVLDKLSLHEEAKRSNIFHDLAFSDIEIMLTGIKECQSYEIRSNLLRMIGLLALLLRGNLNETTSNVICGITEFMLEQAHKESEVWVLAEAVDTLIDLYSEDESNELAVRVKLVEKLSVLAPILKSKSRKQKKLPKEYKALVSTAATNLPRFIKYKKERISKP